MNFIQATHLKKHDKVTLKSDPESVGEVMNPASGIFCSLDIKWTEGLAEGEAGHPMAAQMDDYEKVED